MNRKILGASLGSCVHVAGILSFLRLAETIGYETHFMGPATPIGDIIAAALEWRPNVLAISYRLTPEVAQTLLGDLKSALREAGLTEMELVFGGTPPVAEEAKRTGLFKRVFSGDDGPAEVLAYLRGEEQVDRQQRQAKTLMERLEARAPYPLIRHHFGLPSLEQTIEGIRRIAEARVLDIVSIGPDQNAQYAFFRPDEMDPRQNGAGGVPVRSPADMETLYHAAQAGNFPLLRCYSGTRDLLRWAEMNLATIHNAWAAVPLCWYNILDGRSDRPPEESIPENLAVMAWHGQRDIPVEVNEAHHWSLREAPDVVAVAAAYLAALNAKKQGVKTYIAQYMFNTPYGTSYSADLAKMLAKRTLIESLHDDGFRSLRQVRTGLMSLSANMQTAKGQLASSIDLALQLHPHIVHVVGYSEANHAATPEVVIESCQIIHGVIRNNLEGMPDSSLDPGVQQRRQVLLDEAEILLNAIASLGEGPDPLTNPATIARAIRTGLLDAPHLRGNRYAKGQVQTQLIDGACWAVDEQGKPLREAERLERLFGEKQ